MEKAIFRFAHQEYLWLLALLPVMIAVYAGLSSGLENAP